MSVGLQKLPFNLLYGWWTWECEVDPGGECREPGSSSSRARNKLLSTSPHLCCCYFLTTLILVGTVLCWALKMHTVKHLERTKNEDKAKQFNAGKSMTKVRWSLYGSLQDRSLTKPNRMFLHEIKNIYSWAMNIR